jgi:predicted metal-dependent hydrolase
MSLKRVAVIRKSLAWVQEELEKYPEEIALDSVRNQLIYLLGLVEGTHEDRSKLSDITLGLLGARELDGVIPEQLTELLCEVQGEARRM